jgi:hypothetical protein
MGMASTNVVVDQIRDIENISAEEACERIVAWLTKGGGKVDDKRSKKPNFVQAKHGSYKTISGWAKNAKKVMKFYLTPMESGVHVRVTIEPTSMNQQDVVSWRTEAERNWTELLGELWLEFGAHSESILEEKSLGLAPRIHVLEKEKLSAINELKWGTLGLIISCIGFFVLQWAFNFTEGSEIWTATIVVLSLLTAPSVLLILYGGLKLIQLRSKIKKLK